MTNDSQMAIISNDLDSLIHRIEALPAHEKLTTALLSVMDAKMRVNEARQDLHLKAMAARHAPEGRGA